MIISASRRTDIPSFYSTWFLNRIREKYILVPNPFNPETNQPGQTNTGCGGLYCILDQKSGSYAR